MLSYLNLVQQNLFKITEQETVSFLIFCFNVYFVCSEIVNYDSTSIIQPLGSSFKTELDLTVNVPYS